MPDSIKIQPIAPFRATLRPPGSKSLTNRALLLAALADGTSTLNAPLLADDTNRMIESLQTLGFDLTIPPDNSSITITGHLGQFPSTNANLNLGNAGTAMRPLTAACCLSTGQYQLDGVERMRQRPIGELVDALRQLGADIQYLGQENYPPLQINGKGLTGGEINMPATQSSQFITALLMIAPYTTKGITLTFDAPIISRPYVEMTLGLMAIFGVQATVAPDFSSITVPPGKYNSLDYQIEPDASNASYFLAAAAVIPGSTCTIENLGKRSLQGDVAFADVLHQLGADLAFGQDFITIKSPPPNTPLRGVDIDMNRIPDMAQTLAAIAPLLQGQTVIRNVGNLRVKETDRIAAIQNELTKLGATVTIDNDDISIDPPANNKITPAAIDTYDDHRMAMSFAILGLATDGVTINDPACVNKTFPDYFDFLEILRNSPATDTHTGEPA